MVDEFQAYIGNTLTEMQNQHFLAFSQHHGLPTNLLDFTTSPLVSLYFACKGDIEQNGYVHFINNKRLIDITKHLELVKPGLFAKLALATSETDELYSGISNVLCLNNEYGTEFIRSIDDSIGKHTGNEKLHKALLQAIEEMEKDEDFSLDVLDKLIAAFDRRAKDFKDFETDTDVDELGSYGHIFARFLMLTIFELRDNPLIYLPFYFTYAPPNIIGRISNQSSVLIYQLYGINSIKQLIRPDCSIVITNKEQILSDLDHLGINEKFIFNDYDHIASHVKEKHLKIATKQEDTLRQLRELAANLILK
jgi:hypothetical protein